MKSLARQFSSVGISSILLIAAIGHSKAVADIPGDHPRYLHARTDLRRADILLNAPGYYNVTREMQLADNQIDAAITEIDRASVLDHKDIDDHPAVDTSLNRTGRLRRVYQLLQSAQSDISQEEDNYRAARWRNRSEYHIHQAARLIQRALYYKG